MTKLRVAVVGVGSLGQHHARIAAASEAAELVAVVDSNPARGQEIAAKFGTEWSPELAAVLDRVDAVQIAAPTGIHHALGLQVLAAGKHVIMEKPLAASLDEGHALLAALAAARAARPGLVAAVGHLERFNPAVTALRAMGIKPHFAEAIRVSPFPMRSMEVDVVMDVMIHDLDLLLALIGRPVVLVEAVGVPVSTPYADLVNARLKFEGGAFATVTASRVARKKERVLRAFGSRAYASLDFAAQKLEVLRLTMGPDGPQVNPEVVDIVEGEPLKLELEAFYAACLGLGEDLVPWPDAFEAMKVADRVQKSVAESLAALKMDSMFFDLASLAKPLVTAPLALERLDLDRDRRALLGFEDRPEPLTVRALLSHAAGLPPWLPYTGEPLARQLARGFPDGAHPKLTRGAPGTSLYSDLGYRLLAELLEAECGEDFRLLGARATGLSPAPWPEPPPFAPQGPDLEFWTLAEPDLAFPARDPHLPNDANARAGMRGHAGFGADQTGMRACLRGWAASSAPARMAVDQARSADGARWGLGLQRALTGPGRFGSLLAAVPAGLGGIHVVEWEADRLSPPVPESGPAGAPSAFWFHLGFTGPALFFRPEDGLCLAVLAHRLGPEGELLDAAAIHARRCEALKAWIAGLQ